MLKLKEYMISEDMFKKEKSFDIENTYNLCLNEMGSQQTKRDQLIAFYITILSFAIPAIVSINQNYYAIGGSFIVLYLLGAMLSQVVMRYVVFKETHWISCRTISSLKNFENDKINNELVKHIFYKLLVKNCNTVLVIDPKANKIKKLKTFRKILFSSDAIIYEFLVLIASTTLWIGLFNLIEVSNYNWIISSILTLINLFYWNTYYYKNITRIYACIIDDTEISFNATFAKAWFLHFY